jgi:hypothetical protein
MLKPPAGFIIAKKVGKQELYRRFNDPSFRADIVRRTNQRVDVSDGLASPDCNQEPGTTSHVYDWMEYVAAENRMKLLATIRMFKKPDGTIGASGKPDPIVLVVDGIPLTDP